MNSPFHSLAVRLALRFALLVSIAVLLLSVSFTLALSHSVRQRQSLDLQNAADEIDRNLAVGQERNATYTFPNIPYFITYIVYAQNEGAIVYTNDPFLPLLPQTDGRTKRYISRNYFIDGDLNILYLSTPAHGTHGNLVIQTALNMDTDSSILLLQAIPRTIAVGAIPILLISFCVALFITRHTIRPVTHITQTARHISSSHLDRKLPVKHDDDHTDELDELAITFNELFARLKADFDRERNFTSDVSHELKTPVAVILGQSNLLRRWGKDDPVQVEKSLGIIIREAHSMESIISNLLQLSRLEHKKLLPQKKAMSILALFRRLAEETKAVAPSAQVLFDDTIDHTIVTDAELLHQVCTVVISNSLKFVPTPVKIRLSCVQNGSSLCIRLQDNGNGFAPDVLPHVFERFYRGDSAHTRKTGGSGLGLAIAQAIIHALDGTIDACNDENGSGAVITIHLPMEGVSTS